MQTIERNRTIHKEKGLLKNKTLSKLQKMLLKAPTWSDAEYKEYLEAKNI